MAWQELIALFTFTLFLYASPGPAVITLASSGAVYGFRRSIPFIIGIIIGLGFNLVFTALGAGFLFAQYPFLFPTLKYLSLVYLMYLAYKIATAGNMQLKEVQPFTFFHGVLINTLNPKAFAAAMIIITQFTNTTAGYYQSMVIIIPFILAMVTVIDFGYCFVGELLGKAFSSTEKTSKRINISLAVILVVTSLIITFV